MKFRHFSAGLIFLFVAANFLSAQEKAKTKILAYDGFSTGTSSWSYLTNLRLTSSPGPIEGTIGFSSFSPWTGNSSHIRSRSAQFRELTHPLLFRPQPGSLGHWTFNGVQTVRRNLASAPTAETRIYSLAILFRAYDNPRCNIPLTKSHTTNFPGAYGMIGFTPDNPSTGTGAQDGDKGAKGLSLGYYEDDLRIFAGGKTFTLVRKYKEDTTYLLVAEMKVSESGPEHIRGFHCMESAKKLIPALFNGDNGGKGARVESWSSPKDMAELEFYLADTNKLPFPAQASLNDRKGIDFISWDEVYLIDGPAKTPLPTPNLKKGNNSVPKNPSPKSKRLIAYWPFDEFGGFEAKDQINDNHLTLKQATFTRHDVLGGAGLHFEDKDSGNGSDMASLAYKKAKKAGLAFDRQSRFTFSAWVRGEGNGRFGGLNDIITMCRSGQEPDNRFKDLRGLEFLIANYRLRFGMINSINYPKKDNRLTVISNLKVPDDARYHHVAVTYDGSSKSSGVSFYVDGVQNEGFAYNFGEEGVELTQSVGVIAPLNIGGRNDDHKDAFNYGFSGDIDEVGIFNEVLSDGEVIAIHSVGTAKKLRYNLEQLDSLFSLHRSQQGSMAIEEKMWVPVPRGKLKIGVGRLEKKDGEYYLQLSADGSGVKTAKKK